MRSSGHASHAVALPIASQPNSLDMAGSFAKGCQTPYEEEGDSQEEAACKARQQALQGKAQQQHISAAQADSAADSGDDTEEPDFVAAAQAALPGTAAAASSPNTAEDMNANNKVFDGSPLEMPGLNSSFCWTTWLGKHRTLSSKRLVLS